MKQYSNSPKSNSDRCAVRPMVIEPIDACMHASHHITTTSIITMISTFFVLSPRGDTIINKQYRNDRGDAGAHERSHTEAFFRKIKFWDDSHTTPGGGGDTSSNGATDEAEDESKAAGDAPPVFMMPDGLSYLHVKRNGLIFGCATARNVSAVTVIEVNFFGSRRNATCAQQLLIFVLILLY